MARKTISCCSLLAFLAAIMFAGCDGTGPSVVTPPPANPLPALNPGEVARGRRIYGDECASCHGARAEAASNWQRPDDVGNLPPPPHDDSGHTWRHSDHQLREVIRDGQRDPFNRTPELTMPPLRDRLNDDEIDAVITYFKSLWSDDHRSFQEEQNQRPPQMEDAR